MLFRDAVGVCLTRKYADFSGRARRSEFWRFGLFNLMVSAVQALVMIRASEVEDLSLEGRVVTGLVTLTLVVPNLAVAVRRLHDTSRCGWWLLLILVPVVGWVVLLVFLVQDSHGPNSYGPPPKVPAARSASVDRALEGCP